MGAYWKEGSYQYHRQRDAQRARRARERQQPFYVLQAVKGLCSSSQDRPIEDFYQRLWVLLERYLALMPWETVVAFLPDVANGATFTADELADAAGLTATSMLVEQVMAKDERFVRTGEHTWALAAG